MDYVYILFVLSNLSWSDQKVGYDLWICYFYYKVKQRLQTQRFVLQIVDDESADGCDCDLI